MKSLFAIAALASALAVTAASAAEEQVAVVMTYQSPDGQTATQPMVLDGVSLYDCRSTFRHMLPVLKQRLADPSEFPEFAGWQFVSAKCEVFTDLVTE